MRTEHVIAPQMRQSLGILTMTSLELQAELQHEMASNPLIEDVSGKIERPMSEALPEEHASDEVLSKELDFTPDGTAAERTLSSDDADRDGFLQNMENFEPSAENGAVDPDVQTRRQLMFDRHVHQETLQEHLLAQIPLSDIPEQHRSLAEMLVAYIDDDGYFRGSLPDIEMVTQAREPLILRLLEKIQKLDPVGCGGRDLREVLLAQMEKLDDSPWEDEVRRTIDRHLNAVAERRVSSVCADLGISVDEFPKVLAELRRLDPKPGRGFSPKGETEIYVRPEIFVQRDAKGKWKVRVTERDIPDIRISKKYVRMLEDPSCGAEAKSYIRERLRAAEALIDAIVERQETIRRIAQTVVDAQTEVFERKTMLALRPLTMEQVAGQVGVHNTTVSRTVNEKYMSTPFGVVSLRRFFTSGVMTESGEAVSNVAVRERIRQLVEAEDKSKPLSDAALEKMLKDEGVNVARRTVTKYREAQGIPSTKERRVRS